MPCGVGLSSPFHSATLAECRLRLRDLQDSAPARRLAGSVGTVARDLDELGISRPLSPCLLRILSVSSVASSYLFVHPDHGSNCRAAVVSTHDRAAVYCLRCASTPALGKDRTFFVAAHNSGVEHN